MEDAGIVRVLGTLVDKLTDKKTSEWDVIALRKLKGLCKAKGDIAVKNVFTLLMEKLKEQDARTRLHAFKLVDVLFTRSSTFRLLLSSNFADFLVYSVGHKSSLPLPDPKDHARQLREASLELLETWSEKYGSSLPQIRMGHDYLKNVLKFKFPELRAQQARREAEAAAREARSREIVTEKYKTIKADYITTLLEVNTTLDEMDSSFRLLESRADPLPNAAEDEEWEDIAEEAQHTGNDEIPAEELEAFATETLTLSDAPKIADIKNNDPAVLDSLRDSYKVLVNRHLPLILEWLRIVVRVEADQPGSTAQGRKERILRAAISARDRLCDAKTHCEALLRSSASRSTPGADSVDQAPLIINTSTGEVEQPKKASDLGNAVPHAKQKRSKSVTCQESAVKEQGPKSEPERLLEEVLGSDSDEDSPKASRKRPKVAVRSPQSVLQPPQFVDPTYRRPENALAALSKPETADVTIGQSEERRKEIQKSKLAEDVKRKLLVQAPALPAGTHLAYWDSDKASLLNNKGMEVYNHWGAVDENVQLPEHVISQFFTTRASYYDPTKETIKRPRGEEKPEEVLPDEPPKKKISRVTPVGLGPAAMNKLSIPTLPLLVAKSKTVADPQPDPDGLSILPPSKVTSAPATQSRPPSSPATGTEQQQQQNLNSAAKSAVGVKAPDLPAPSNQMLGNDGIIDITSKPPAKMHEAGGRAKGRAGVPGRGVAKQKATERGTATQRAMDKAHNDAVLSQAGDAVGEPLKFKDQASVGKRGAKTQAKPTVRQRLAAKLLSGGARDRAISEVDAIEHERTRDADSRRWVT